MMLHGDHGSAWRRRQRRLRSWWRHEQQSVAMALSTAAHHTFDKVAAGEKYDGLRAQKTDRAGEAANKAPQRQRSNAAGDAVFFELFDTAGVRPGVLAEPRPQERVQRHVVEHITDLVRVAPTVQILDAPVPQTVEQLPDVLLLRPIPSGSSKCPRFFLRTSLCARLSVTRSWQNSWWKCRRSYPILGCSYVWSRTLTFWSWWAEFWSSRFSSRTGFKSVAVFWRTYF